MEKTKQLAMRLVEERLKARECRTKPSKDYWRCIPGQDLEKILSVTNAIRHMEERKNPFSRMCPL